MFTPTPTEGAAAPAITSGRAPTWTYRDAKEREAEDFARVLPIDEREGLAGMAVEQPAKAPDGPARKTEDGARDFPQGPFPYSA